MGSVSPELAGAGSRLAARAGKVVVGWIGGDQARGEPEGISVAFMRSGTPVPGLAHLLGDNRFTLANS